MQAMARSMALRDRRPLRSVSWPRRITSFSRVRTAKESLSAASATASLIEFEPISIAASFKLFRHSTKVVLQQRKPQLNETSLSLAPRQIELERRESTRFRAPTESPRQTSLRKNRPLSQTRTDRARPYLEFSRTESARDDRASVEGSETGRRD